MKLYINFIINLFILIIGCIFVVQVYSKSYQSGNATKF